MPIAPRTILLVEDNPDDEELTLRALARNNIGNQVVVVRDGQDAVDWLEGDRAVRVARRERRARR